MITFVGFDGITRYGQRVTELVIGHGRKAQLIEVAGFYWIRQWSPDHEGRAFGLGTYSKQAAFDVILQYANDLVGYGALEYERGLDDARP